MIGGPGPVPRRALDLDDIGAHVGKRHRRVGPRDPFGHVDDGDLRQNSSLHGNTFLITLEWLFPLHATFFGRQSGPYSTPSTILKSRMAPSPSAATAA